MIRNIVDPDSIHQMMIKIPDGKIVMRDDRKKHTWEVIIKQFLLSKYPITQELYFAVTKTSPSTFQCPNAPVETVSWIDAVGFCNTLSQSFGFKECYTKSPEGEGIIFKPSCDGFRLPTEAEWEYACRAGSKNVQYGFLDNIAWYNENSDGRTHGVGQKEPNEWGLYDMLGNVWEWCSDMYDENEYGSYRLIRGGGWADQTRGCLASNRRRSHPTYSIDDLGFRIARNIC